MLLDSFRSGDKLADDVMRNFPSDEWCRDEENSDEKGHPGNSDHDLLFHFYIYKPHRFIHKGFYTLANPYLFTRFVALHSLSLHKRKGLLGSKKGSKRRLR